MIDRRQFLRAALAAAAAPAVGRVAGVPVPIPAAAAQPPSPYGGLQGPDAHGILLPAGFTAREVARSGRRVAGSDYTWHRFPDGGATFPAPDGGWAYVSNSELLGLGGAGAVRFDAGGEVVDAYRVLARTTANCAGGPTPWGTWLSCEEHPRGRVWECDPMGERDAEPRPALGVFQHEAAGVDEARRHLYLTEDQPDGRFYRFTPERWPDLGAGVLEVAAVDGDGGVRWLAVPDPSTRTGGPTRHQVPESTSFTGGEGLWVGGDTVWFTTKGDDRVWAYDPEAERLSVLYDGRAQQGAALHGVDNVTASAAGDLVVAEDGGNMELVLVTPEGAVAPLLRVEGQEGSELAGPAFSPDGRRLYVSSQRGFGDGVTYEVTGPFRGQPPQAGATTSPSVPPPGAALRGRLDQDDDGTAWAVPVGAGAATAAVAGAAVWALRRRLG